MLTKEYRILLPLSVEEYRIAQLYMILKKSRLDSEGAGAGVEIITNEPYEKGPGGGGQYTYKIYHVGSRLPAWIRAVLPTEKLHVHEEAHNAFPYTHTRYSVPLMDRFSIQVETVYCNDAGVQENVFQLPEEELKQRAVDLIDFVNDPISAHEYCEEEDPKLFVSEKTGRGKLTEDWVAECVRQKKAIMCAYKLIRVEFRYWGLQTRAERFIHDTAMRKTMMRAHRQAWAWQDEWVGLTLADIRRLEVELATHLSTVMAESDSLNGRRTTEEDSRSNSIVPVEEEDEDEDEEKERDEGKENHQERSARLASDAISDDIYFDCYDGFEANKTTMVRWSSELLLEVTDVSPPPTPKTAAQRSSPALLVMLFQADSALEPSADRRLADAATLRQTVEQIVDRHYPQLKGRIHWLSIPCGDEWTSAAARVCAVAPAASSTHQHSPLLSLLLNTNERSYREAVEGAVRRANEQLTEFYESLQDGGLFHGEVLAVADSLGGLLLYEMLTLKGSGSGGNPPWCWSHAGVSRHSSAASTTAAATSTSTSANGPTQCVANNLPPLSALPSAMLANNSVAATTTAAGQRNLSAPPSAGFVRKKISMSSASEDLDGSRLWVQPSAAFLLGCPLGLVLLQRKFNGREIESVEGCKLFNLYYPLDPCAARIEPVLNSVLSVVAAPAVPRYQKESSKGSAVFLESAMFPASIDCAQLWGPTHIDHVLYCPQSMSSLPAGALPNILRASYWESSDVASFIVRWLVGTPLGDGLGSSRSGSVVVPPLPDNLPMPDPHWNRRRTRFKVHNLAANHRANDAISVLGDEQRIQAKFCYGPMDLVALSHEQIQVFVCPARGDWRPHGSFETDARGRLSVSFGNTLPAGLHQVRMIVTGDRSYLDAYLAVVHKETRCVVFSVDGALTASVSVTGRDPRVRPGAPDVVRFWHDQGYLIIYMTARPDIQQRVVSAWLAQHNFPLGLLFFAPSFSTDPLRQKTDALRTLIRCGLIFHAAYGSAKDVAVYQAANIDGQSIFSAGGGRRKGCHSVEHYASHVAQLTSGELELARPADQILPFHPALQHNSSSDSSARNTLRRAHSFAPRSGKYEQRAKTALH